MAEVSSAEKRQRNLACYDLGLAIVNTEADIKEKYKELFNGVGLLRGYELKLNIDNSVKPVAQPVRRIPFGVREKVERKLDELLESGIIEEVPEGPTGWVSPLVVIPKAPEKYQQIIRDVLRGCEGVANIADDLIIHGRGEDQHDKRLLAVLDRLRETGLTLNEDIFWTRSNTDRYRTQWREGRSNQTGRSSTECQ